MISRINERRRPPSLRGEVADLSVTTAKLADGAVTPEKLNAFVQTYLRDVNARLLYLEPATAFLEAASLAIASGTETPITPFFTGRITSRFLSSNSVTLLSGDQLTSGVPFSSGILTVDTSFTLLTVDWNGEQATYTIAISAVQLPTALLTVDNGITNLFLGISTTLNIQFTNGTPTFNDQPLLPNNQSITNPGSFRFEPPLGTTRYTLTVTNVLGQTDSAFVDYTVVLQPTALVTAIGPTTFVQSGGISSSFNIQFTNGTAALQRSFNTVNVGQPELISVPGPSTPVILPVGTTRYTLTVTTVAGSVSSFVEYTVTAPAPSATGWYGPIVMRLQSFRGAGENVSYNYTIYRGSTTSATVLANNVNINTNAGNGAIGTPQTININPGERLANNLSTFLVIVNQEPTNNGTLIFGGVGGGTITSQTGFFTAQINPTVPPGDPVTFTFYMFD